MALLVFHVVAGSVALGVGFAALFAPKGRMTHRRAGLVFVAAMLAMGLSGSIVAVLRPERETAVVGLIVAYLAVTGWRAAERRDGRAGLLERLALPVVIGCGCAQLVFGIQASGAPDGRLDGLPAAAHYPFALLAALAAVLDVRFIWKGALSPSGRIARHLWRMSAALLIAAASFFLGQQDEFPAAWRGSAVWFAPLLTIIFGLVYWLARVCGPTRLRARLAV